MLEPDDEGGWREDLHRAAANSIARQTIQPLADGHDGRGVIRGQFEIRKTGRGALDKERDSRHPVPNRRPQAHGPSPAPPREAAETPAHRARAAAPGWWQGRRDQGFPPRVRRCRATARTRSQLSRTSRSRFDARNVASVSRKGWPETSRTPSAAAMVGRTSVGSISGERSTKTTPSANNSRTRIATPIARRVFPTHLGP